MGNLQYLHHLLSFHKCFNLNVDNILFHDISLLRPSDLKTSYKVRITTHGNAMTFKICNFLATYEVFSCCWNSVQICGPATVQQRQDKTRHKLDTPVMENI